VPSFVPRSEVESPRIRACSENLFTHRLTPLRLPIPLEGGYERAPDHNAERFRCDEGVAITARRSAGAACLVLHNAETALPSAVQCGFSAGQNTTASLASLLAPILARERTRR
jgi:hypothetical protein